ncbi:EVE domain-containing protein, partial [Cryomyces antarcticus]
AATNSCPTAKDPSTAPKARGRPAKTAGPDLSTTTTSSAAPDAASTRNSGTAAAAGGPAHWLMKAESESRNNKGVNTAYTIDDLKAKMGPEQWEGVRNFMARDNLQAMKKGDLAFFYASNGKDPGIVGTMEIVEEATPDETAFDASSHYYAKRSTRETPVWFVVKVAFRSKFKTPIILRDLKRNASPGGPLEGLETVYQPRLSVSKITPGQWNYIINNLAEEDEDQDG